ncbi:MAG: proline dehydrogenase family protein [Planctomycetes bacterium]|nr:proline dehydrogenase family protein [Planctomycetota bacterium]
MDPLERSIRRIGLELFAAQAAHQPWPLSRAWLHDRGMALSLSDPALQLALFRFIDALPSARDGATAARLLREHLQPVAGRLPEPARRALAALPAAPAGWVGALAGLGARELAARFLLGARIPAIVRHLDRLHRRGLCFTVDRLGEAVLTEAEADAYLASYLELLPALTGAAAAWPAQPGVPAVNLSIKLSALTSRFEPADPAGTCARVGARLRPLLRAARAAGALVNLDMEHHAYRDATLHILRTLGGEDEFRAWDGLGIAIQAYLRGCGDDLAMLAAWAQARGAPLWVRLVKGAYWDHETALADSRGWDCPVHRDKGATDAAYERHTRFLLESRRWLRPAFASHNVRSLAHAIALRDRLGIPAHEVEFQLLHGMADPLKAALAGRGERVRVYCPVGELLPGVAYLVRRLLENTSNQGFVRASSLENRPSAELLAAPTPADPPAKEPSMFSNHPCADFSCEDQRRAMADALGALPGWEAAGWEARIACLERLAGRLAEDRWRLAALLVREVAKSWREADAEVCELIDFCRYYAVQACRLAAGAAVDAPGETNDTVYGPRGVAVVIAPWNFPLAILGGMAVAALVAGNPVVLKPAEQAPVVAWALHRHLLAAGIPAEAVHYLPGDGEEVGPALADHPATALIAFTGSRAVGLGLNRRAAEALDQRRQVVRVLAEMGGKNAIIVDASADLDEAVAGVLASAFGYQGQKCSACSRAIVHRDRYRDFAARLAEAVRALEPGPADHPGHLFGPVIDDQARLRLERQCAELDARHRCLVRGDIGDWAGQGAWVAPRLYGEVDPGSWLAQEELFGPVLALIPADSLEQALAIANGTRYALTGGCFARSPAALAQVRAGFAVGNLYLNRGITGALVHRQPFGGFRLSGIGSKAGGPDYLQQFCLPRVITENTLRHGMVGRRDERPGTPQ